MKLTFRTSLLTLVFAVAGQLFTASAQIPRFLPPVSYTVPGAAMVAVADINGDGILDLVTANEVAPNGDGGVSILLGIGHGTFHPAKQIVKGGSPGWVLVGDFNNDGNPDLAIANEPDPDQLLPVTGGPAPNSISILLGNGDGTFQPSIDTPTAGAVQIAEADFNGDGKLDLAVVTGDSLPLQILLNHGDGRFTVTDTTINSFTRVLAGDFNKDGKQDFIANGLVMLGNGDGTFTAGQGLDLFPTLAADFNGDGILDLVELSGSVGRLIISNISLGLPGGNFAPSFISTLSGFEVVAADFNGDGKTDVFGTGGPTGDGIDPPIGGLALGAGDGTFTFGGPGFGAPLASGFKSAFAAVGDFDGNGSPDIAITNGFAVLVALNTFGHPPLLAQLITDTTFVVGGTTTVRGTVSLGAPAAAGGVIVTLASNKIAATLPKTVKIPAGAVSASFTISTNAVTVSTPVTITATYHFTKLTTDINVVAPSTVVSVSVSPASLIGMFGGDAAVGTVTLSGPAPNGTTVSLSSANAAVVTVPASVAFTPGATTATFPISAQHVTANTTVAVSATFGTITRSATVAVLKETPTVVVTKAEYVVKKSLFTIEATSTDRVGNLQVFNATTGAVIGTMPIVNVGKFSGQFIVTGSFTSVAVQSTLGGLTIAPVVQK
jgi:FG-GAP-like repeat